MQPQQAAAPAPQTQAQGDIAKALYDNGVQSFNARNYKQALKSFSDFTDTYGKHKLVSNAWFWRGECNYQLGNFPAAALDYEQVISKYGLQREGRFRVLEAGDVLHQGREEGRRQGPLAGTHQEIPQVA